MNPMYDLEQPILRSFGIIDDLRMLVKTNAPPEAFLALATVYDIHFNHFWELYEETLPKVQARPVLAGDKYS
jgi:hypothetical protein